MKKYRVWVCMNCGAVYNVTYFYPDRSFIDRAWNVTVPGVHSLLHHPVNDTVICCPHPNVEWTSDFLEIALDDTVTVPEDVRVDRFDTVISDLKSRIHGSKHI